MNAAGFDYVAAVPPDLELEKERNRLLDEGVDGQELLERLDEVELPEDPNSTFRESLSSAEQKAWDETYWGVEPGGSGCYASTYESAWGVSVEELMSTDAVDEIERHIENDPEILAARDQLVDCINAEGYEFESFDEAHTYPPRREAQVLRSLEQAGLLVEGGPDVSELDEYIEYTEEMEAFNRAWQPCERAYQEVVEPLENQIINEVRSGG